MKITDRPFPADSIECHHCEAVVADVPYPRPDDDAAWELEAREHAFGCAAILTRGGARPAPCAPVYARGHHYPDGDPLWPTVAY